MKGLKMEIIKVPKTNHSPEKIDLAIKQLEQEIITLDNMAPVDYVVDICIKNNYRQSYVFYLKYRFLNIHKQREEAEEWLKKAISQSEIENNHDLYMKSLLNQGDIEYEKGHYQLAIKVWMECLEYAVKVGNNETTGFILLNIGKTYSNIKSINEAQYYYEKSWAIALKTEDTLLKGCVCIHLAIIYFELKMNEKALAFADKGEQYIHKIEKTSSIYSELMLNYAYIKYQKGSIEEAISITKTLYNFNIAQDLKWQKNLCELNLGEFYYHGKNYEESIQWFQSALTSAQMLDADHMEMTIYKWLYTVNLEKENYQLALYYYTNYIKAYECLFKEDDKPVINLFEEDIKNLIFKSQLLLLDKEFNV